MWESSWNSNLSAPQSKGLRQKNPSLKKFNQEQMLSPFTLRCSFNIQNLWLFPHHSLIYIGLQSINERHLEQNIETVWLDQCCPSFNPWLKTLFGPLRLQTNKNTTQSEMYGTPMVNRTVKLSTWECFITVLKKWVFVVLFVNTLKNPGMAFPEMKMWSESFRSHEDMWSLWVTNRGCFLRGWFFSNNCWELHLRHFQCHNSTPLHIHQLLISTSCLHIF